MVQGTPELFLKRTTKLILLLPLFFLPQLIAALSGGWMFLCISKVRSFVAGENRNPDSFNAAQQAF
jgi:hypothetical protein